MSCLDCSGVLVGSLSRLDISQLNLVPRRACSGACIGIFGSAIPGTGSTSVIELRDTLLELKNIVRNLRTSTLHSHCPTYIVGCRSTSGLVPIQSSGSHLPAHQSLGPTHVHCNSEASGTREPAKMTKADDASNNGTNRILCYS
jgi:hypothetical protein